MESKLALNIAWLYPGEMSTYGDRGNVLTLWQRCKWRGIKAEVTEINLGDQIDPTKFDIYFFGGGQDQAQTGVSKDLQSKKEPLRKAVRLGAVFLGICGGYQLFGHYYRPFGSEDLPGLGILDVTTLASDTRMIGNILIEADKALQSEGVSELVGFENHSGKTFVGKRSKPLGKVLVGFGNNSEDRTEGAYEGNVFGCYLHGPILPKNPKFADLLIKRALKRRFGFQELKELDDSIENETHIAVTNKTKETR